MTIDVKLFAQARDLAGASPVSLEVPSMACVRELRSALAARYPSLKGLAPTLLVAIDNRYAADDQKLDPQAEVACFPPVSGG